MSKKDEPPRAGSAVLVISVWFETEAPGDGGFRARITWTEDVRAAGMSKVVTDPAQVVSVVSDWLGRVS